MTLSWKPDWDLVKQHYLTWWKHEGLVLASWEQPASLPPREVVIDPGSTDSAEFFFTHPKWRAQRNHFTLARSFFGGDAFPVADTMTGPGSLALYLGSEPGLTWDTVWFKPCILGEHPEEHSRLVFDPANPWWRLAEEVLVESAALARGKYLVGCPDLVENIDILASLRDPQTLLIDLIERPGWVEEKVWEINAAWFEVYSRVFEIIQDDEGGSAFSAFQIWGPGKTAKVQCDTCAMFSPRMFERFVKPALSAQCAWLDYSMYHLDGHHCFPHLDLLLSIDTLDAIEYTPDPQVPGGGSPEWYLLYRKILAAGKSVQAIGVKPEEVEPLLDAVGGKGMYIATDLTDPRVEERLLRAAEPYR